MPLAKQMAKKRSADFMSGYAKTRKAEEAAFDAKQAAEIDDLVETVASESYRDNRAGRRGRNTFALSASYLPSIINGKRVKE